jgi:hypothetical protein
MEKKQKMEEKKELRDTFQISLGNRKVLELIPSMMEDNHFRYELRRLASDFLSAEIFRSMKTEIKTK